MTLKEEQAKFDEQKWTDSLVDGDKCGSYIFCSACNMDEEFPCARASRRYKKANPTEKPAKKPATRKTAKKA